MNKGSFGELILTTKTNLNGMLKYEWINFKKYAEIHFKYLKIKHLVHHWNGWLMEVTLHMNNGPYVEFQNFITKNNLIEFVQNNGYDSFVNQIELKKYNNDNNDNSELCEDKINNNDELQINIEI